MQISKEKVFQNEEIEKRKGPWVRTDTLCSKNRKGICNGKGLDFYSK